MLEDVANLLVKVLETDPSITWLLERPVNDDQAMGKTACVYLIDVREATDYRDVLPRRRVNAGILEEFQPSLHLTAAFLVCGKFLEKKDLSYGILHSAARSVHFQSEISKEFFQSYVNDIEDAEKKAFLENLIKEDLFTPIRLSMSAEGRPGQTELWTSLGLELRPSLIILATFATHDMTPGKIDAPLILRTILTSHAGDQHEESNTYAVTLKGMATYGGVAMDGPTIRLEVPGIFPAQTATASKQGEFEFSFFSAAKNYEIYFSVISETERPGEPLLTTRTVKSGYTLTIEDDSTYKPEPIGLGNIEFKPSP